MSNNLPVTAPDSTAEPAARALRWRFGTVVVDGRTLETTVDGQLVKLEPKTLQLLLYLLRHSGEVVTKEELHENIWPGRILSESLLAKTVSKLRLALDDEDQKIIKTVHGYGYRLIAAVTLEAADKSAPLTLGGHAVGDTIPHRPHWRLTAALGSGGQGEAWLGQHHKTGEQHVFKFAFDAPGLMALRRELTVFRLLQHSHGSTRADFVRLIDSNLEEPPYFIETEYVAGGALPDWITSKGGFAAVPRALRLTLIAQVAEGLAAAHAAGVLHKDIKPANILIDESVEGSPQIKLGDFGSGRVLDLARLEQLEITRMGIAQTTTDGVTSGTPLYLAPELLGGQQPTVQSDIYALGVVFFQLLVGDFKRPLAPGWELEIDDPLLQQDIAFAAASQPALRLPHADALAVRLRSLDARREAQAQQQQARMALENAEREASSLRLTLAEARSRRHWLRALAAVLALGLGLSALGFWQARGAQLKAEAAQAEANAISRFLQDDVLGSANPVATGEYRTVKGLLDVAAAKLDADFAGSADAEAQIRFSLAKAYEGLGEWPLARAQLEAALEDHAASANPALQRQLLFLLGSISILQSRYEEGIQHYSEARSLALAEGGENARDVLTADAGLAKADYGLARYSESAARYQSIVDRALALSPPDEVLAAATQLDKVDPLFESNRYAEAETILVAALERQRRTLGETHPRYLWNQCRLVDFHIEKGRYAEAEALLASIRPAMKTSLGEQHPYTLSATHYLGILRLRQQRYPEAVALFRTALKGRMAITGPNHVWVRYSQNRLGEALTANGQIAEAMRVLQAALTGCRAAQGSAHPNCLFIASNLSDAYTAAGEHAQSAALLAEVAPLALAHHSGTWRIKRLLLLAQARHALAIGERMQARHLTDELLQDLAAVHGEQHPEYQRLGAELLKDGG